MATARPVPTSAERAGARERPRPASSAKRIPTTLAMGIPADWALRATAELPTGRNRSRLLRWGAPRAESTSAAIPSRPSNTASPIPKTVQSTAIPWLGRRAGPDPGVREEIGQSQ